MAARPTVLASGEPLPLPVKVQHRYRTGWSWPVQTDLEKMFQWLPAEAQQQPDGSWSFQSYINNLHPGTVARWLPLCCTIVRWNVELSP